MNSRKSSKVKQNWLIVTSLLQHCNKNAQIFSIHLPPSRFPQYTSKQHPSTLKVIALVEKRRKMKIVESESNYKAKVS